MSGESGVGGAAAGGGGGGSGVVGGLIEFGCRGKLLANGQCILSESERSLVSSLGGGRGGWWSDWWLIPILVLLVVLSERAYSLCRRRLSRGSGSVDSSEFSALQQSEGGDGAEDEDEAELQYGLSDTDAGEQQPKHGGVAQEAQLQKQQQQQQQAQQSNGAASK